MICSRIQISNFWLNFTEHIQLIDTKNSYIVIAMRHGYGNTISELSSWNFKFHWSISVRMQTLLPYERQAMNFYVMNGHSWNVNGCDVIVNADCDLRDRWLNMIDETFAILFSVLTSIAFKSNGIQRSYVQETIRSIHNWIRLKSNLTNVWLPRKQKYKPQLSDDWFRTSWVMYSHQVIYIHYTQRYFKWKKCDYKIHRKEVTPSPSHSKTWAQRNL